jgi:small conductance mechanosensitive channel
MRRMPPLLSNGASDAAQNVADSLNKGSITGWDLLAAVLVIVLSGPIARLVAAAVKRAFKHAGIVSSDAAADVGRVAKWLVYLIGLAVAASILGVNVGFLSVLFAFTLVLGALALKPMIENSASGILLLSRPEFSIGDQIETTEFRGIVKAIGSRTTQLSRSDGVVVFVSNNQVLGNPITVYSSSDSRKGSFDIKVLVNADLDEVTRVLMHAITSVDHVVADPAPAVQAAAITDDAITLAISYWYPSTRQTGSSVTDGVIRATVAALRTGGIALAVPDAKVTEEPASNDDETSDDKTSDKAGANNDDD